MTVCVCVCEMCFLRRNCSDITFHFRTLFFEGRCVSCGCVRCFDPSQSPDHNQSETDSSLLRFGVRTAVSEQNSPLSRCDNLLFYCCDSYTFSEPSIIQTSTLRVYFVYSFESSVVLMRTVNSEACGLS